MKKRNIGLIIAVICIVAGITIEISVITIAKGRIYSKLEPNKIQSKVVE